MTAFWHKYVGLEGGVVGIDTFGESAPAGVLFKHSASPSTMWSPRQSPCLLISLDLTEIPHDHSRRYYGYGRIGRNVLRAHYEGGKKHDIESLPSTISAMHRRMPTSRNTIRRTASSGTVSVDGDFMIVNGDKIRVLANRNPAEQPWGELNVDVVLECTGFFTTKERPALT